MGPSLIQCSGITNKQPTLEYVLEFESGYQWVSYYIVAHTTQVFSSVCLFRPPRTRTTSGKCGLSPRDLSRVDTMYTETEVYEPETRSPPVWASSRGKCCYLERGGESAKICTHARRETEGESEQPVYGRR